MVAFAGTRRRVGAGGVKFGSYTPDLPQFGHDGLVIAKNVFPIALGYEPVKQYSAVTVALPVAWQGGKTFIGINGTARLLAGTNDGLYAYISDAWVLAHSDTYSNFWQFAQFGDLAIGVQGSDPVKYGLESGTADVLGGSPPSGRYITTVKDFVVIAGVDSANSTVYWSAINNAEGWTVGTDQSDTQVIPDGGEITGLAGGEYMLVFQREQIWRGQYVGVPFIFQFDKVAQGIGTIAANSVIMVGRTAYFISQRGFCAFTDGNIELIGANKVDKTFFETYSVAEITSSVRVAVDPFRKLVIWAMPSKFWVYNWELQRWSTVEGEYSGISTAATTSWTYEQIEAEYPGGMETVPGSFDDPIWRGGDPFLMIVANDGTLGTFGSQTTQEAILRTARLEPIPGRKTRIRSVRIDGDVTSGILVNMSVSDRLGDISTSVTANAIRTNGDVPIRAMGRYIQPTITFSSGAAWEYAQGFDFIQVAAGARQ